MERKVLFGDNVFMLFSGYMHPYFTCPNSVTFPTNIYEKKSPGRNAFTKRWNEFYTNDFPVHKNKLLCNKISEIPKKKVPIFY